MISNELLQSYVSQFEQLAAIVEKSNERVIGEEPDELFEEYLNVFVKAYLVSACSILEAFVTDGAFACLENYKQRVLAAKIPHNLVQWEVLADEKKRTNRTSFFEIKKNRKSINDDVSGNYYLTKNLFRKLGIELEHDEEFKGYAETISATIGKRNSIVHHNDAASDLSLSDVLTRINEFKSYASCIFRVVNDQTLTETI